MISQAVTSFLALLMPFHITLHFCEPGTACSECVESIPLWVTVDQAGGNVWAMGRRSDGERILERLENCVVTDRENWSCASASRFEATAGRITVSVGARWAHAIEVCTTQDR